MSQKTWVSLPATELISMIQPQSCMLGLIGEVSSSQNSEEEIQKEEFGGGTHRLIF